MKIVFFGSSDFSLPSLDFCRSPAHELLTVVTTPDRPKGRGLHLQPNPVKKHSEQLGIPVHAPSTLKDAETQKKIASLKPDFFVVASYGKLIPSSWLTIPQVAAWNVHPSLLPKYRGAAPLPWQIINDEKETGVTLALVTKELDAGDIVHQVRVPLESQDTTESLTRRLAELSPKALEEAFSKLQEGRLVLTPQKESDSNYARKLTKEDGCLNLEEEAPILERKIRAFHPWPGTFIGYGKEPLRIVEAAVDSIAGVEAGAGTLLGANGKGCLRIQTGKGSLKVLKVQLPGRRIVSGAEFANGQRLQPGFRFESLK